jgi:hypothetical protein
MEMFFIVLAVIAGAGVAFFLFAATKLNLCDHHHSAHRSFREMIGEIVAEAPSPTPPPVKHAT